MKSVGNELYKGALINLLITNLGGQLNSIIHLSLVGSPIETILQNFMYPEPKKKL